MSLNSDLYIEECRERRTPYKVVVANIPLAIHDTVFPTSQLGEFFAEVMQDKRHGINFGDKVLDYGCGSGFLSIIAQKLGADVVATDINPKAVECSQENFLANKVKPDAISLRLGAELSKIESHEKFDTILANLPWEANEARDDLELAFYDPQYRMRNALFANARNLLKPTGRILFSYGARINREHPIEDACSEYTVTMIAEKFIHDEPHYIYSITPQTQYNYAMT